MIGNKLTPFKFWCQKVLPTVYDDSLSYYEYLNKLNEYLNEVIEQINTLTEAEENFQEDLSQQWEDYKTGLNDDWLEYKTGLTAEWNEYKTQLTQAWTETKNYIDNYFNNLDVQEEINNKLNAMALDGTLTDLIEPLVSTDIPSIVTAWLTENVDPVGSAVVVDNSLSVSGAAADAKVSGDEIRKLITSKTNYYDFNEIEYEFTDNGYVNGNGDMESSVNAKNTGYISVSPNEIFYIKALGVSAFDCSVACYDINKDFVLSASKKGATNGYFCIPSDVYYIICSYVGLSNPHKCLAFAINDLDLKADKNAVERVDYAFVNHGYVESTGGYTDTDNARSTYPIKVNYGDQFTVVSTISSAGCSIACYNSNMVFDNNNSVVGSFNGTFTVPSDVSYIVCSVYGVSNEHTCVSVPYDLVPIEIPFSKSGYVATDGTVTETINASHTDYIPVKKNDRLFIKCNIGTSGCSISCYDESRTWIESNSIVGSYDGYFIVPWNVKYVIASYYNHTFVHKCTLFPSDTHLMLEDKHILIFGDSITECCDFTINSDDETTAVSWRNPSNSYVKDGQTITYSMWAKILKINQNCENIRDYAQSGASYKTQSRSVGNERQNLQYQITVALNDVDNPNSVFPVNNFDPNIVIFALGTNDGEPNDTFESAMSKTVYQADNVSIDVDATIANLDDTKFCESARKAYLRIKKEFPMAQIYVVLPIQRASNDTNFGTLKTYLTEMANRYGCVIVDATSHSGITRDFNTRDALGVYLKDGLHPNEKGQNLLARTILK